MASLRRTGNAIYTQRKAIGPLSANVHPSARAAFHKAASTRRRAHTKNRISRCPFTGRKLAERLIAEADATGTKTSPPMSFRLPPASELPLAPATCANSIGKDVLPGASLRVLLSISPTRDPNLSQPADTDIAMTPEGI